MTAAAEVPGGMATATRSGMVRWVPGGLAVAAVVTLGAVALVAGDPSGSSWEATPGHVARTAAHLVGIAGGLGIVYYAVTVHARTRGSTLGRSMFLVGVGTALFVLVFLGMESQHLLGVDLWYFADTMAVTQLWFMLALTAVMALYTVAYRNLVVEMGG